MLHLEEIGALIGTSPDAAKIRELRETIRFRELMFNGYTKFTPPNELGRGLAGDENVTNAAAPDSGVLKDSVAVPVSGKVLCGGSIRRMRWTKSDRAKSWSRASPIRVGRQFWG